MKLTNLQLSVLVNTLYNKVQEKLVALKANTKLVNSAEAKAKKEMKYSEKEKYAKTYDTLTSEKDKIQDKMNNLKEEYIEKILKGNYYYGNPIRTIQELNVELENNIEKILLKDLPTREDIQSDIVLLSINGSKDILTEVSKKYKL